MANKRREFDKGIRLRPTTDATTTSGEERVDSADNKKKVYLDGQERAVVTENQTQDLDNKTIDGTSATGTNTVTADSENISYDNSTSGLAATDVKTAIDELDTRLENQDEASEISYDNSTSGLAATDVQAAIDEVEARVDTVEGDTYVNTFEGRSGTVTAQSGDYEASEVTYSNATSGLTATDTQAAIDEVEGRVDTIEGATYVNSFNSRTGAVTPAASDYDADQVDYDNTTSGLTATDTQAAIDEVDGNLNTHIPTATGVHGVTGNVVGTTDTQDLSNKTFTDAITLEELSSTPSTPSSGDKKFYAKDDGQIYTLDDAGNEVPVGSGEGGGALNFYENGTAETPTSTADFTTGNNASFDGGGSLAGTFEISTTAADLIRGEKSFKFTQAAGSLNDYIASTVIDIPQGYRGRELNLKFQYKYDGNDSDINWVVKDQTNTNTLSDQSINSFTGSNNIAGTFIISFFCPSDCQQIKIGPQVKVANNGSVFIWDDVIVSPDLISVAGVIEDSYALRAGLSATYNITTSGNFGIIFDDITASVSPQTFDETDGDYDNTTGLLTFSKAGLYQIKVVGLLANAVTENYNLRIRDLTNGTTLNQSNVEAGSGETVEVFSLHRANAGEQIQIQINSDTDTSYGLQVGGTYLFVQKIPEPQENIITQTDSVQPILSTGSTNLTVHDGTQILIDFETTVEDDGGYVQNAGAGYQTVANYLNGWQYVVPKKGWYSISASFRYSETNNFDDGEYADLSVYKNGSLQELIDDYEFHATSGNAPRCFLNGSYSNKYEVGDIIQVATSSNNGAGSLNAQAYINISKLDKQPLAAIPNQTRYQIKTLSADVTSTGVMSDLTFITEIGKTYKISGKALFQNTTSSGNIRFEIKDGSTVVDVVQFNSNSADDTGVYTFSANVLYKAESTSLTFDVTGADSNDFIRGDDSRAETYFTLEELPNHIETNQF